jgi:coenzyme F420-reducing hydrogenase alpha subunit
MATIKIAPSTRLEGHMEIIVEVDAQRRVTGAEVRVTMARGFEEILYGRSPEDTVRLTQRICGVCPIPHAAASVRAWESAFQVTLDEVAKKIIQLMKIGNCLHSHFLHWFFLAGPDYRKWSKEELTMALKARIFAQRIVALLGARPVHPAAIVLGGHTRMPSSEALDEILDYLEGNGSSNIDRGKLKYFVEEFYLPIVEGISFPETGMTTQRNFVSGGDFYSASGVVRDGEEPINWDVTKVTQETHSNSYTKIIKFDGVQAEVGPLARLIIARVTTRGRSYNSSTPNTIGARHLARADEAAILRRKGVEIVQELREALREYPAGKKIVANYGERKTGEGIGVVEAPRGILIHKVRSEAGEVKQYEVITPTAWNTGAIERALRDSRPLLEDVEKIVRAFDPCFSCSAQFFKITVRK